LENNGAVKKPLYQTDDGEICSVEMFALKSYEKKEWKGYHSENSLCTTLFAILFFDIMFTPKPDVFESEYQSTNTLFVSALC
jgi:Fanconi-associated nuclease 1